MGGGRSHQKEESGIMISRQWKDAFFQAASQFENASLLREAALQEDLAGWTRHLTEAVVQSCGLMGWQSAAKGHHLDVLPVPHCEYFTLDVVAFPPSSGGNWQFPIAAMELENSRDNQRIAYALWKLLCIRTDLRVVFCYRRLSEQAPELVRYLQQQVIEAMPLASRINLEGETLVVVGVRNDSASFPYGFFKWWALERNAGMFNII